MKVNYEANTRANRLKKLKERQLKKEMTLNE
jgi:hypothetical protein